MGELTLNDMLDSMEAESKEVAKIEGRLDYLDRLQGDIELQEAAATKKLEDAKSAQDVLQQLAQAVQQQVHQRSSAVVTSCLSSVFPDPYSFQIEFERKRGKTEAKLRFVRGNGSFDPLTSAGGGMVDVAAFALRISCFMLHRPRLSKILIADEPFRFVPAQYQDSIRKMLEQLSWDMGVQIIFVTHNETYESGKIVLVQ